MTMTYRNVVPHPLLTLLLVVTWCLLTNSVHLGNVILAAILGVVIPKMTFAYWPDAPHGIKAGRMVSYVLVVVWDILLANVAVAWLVLTRPNRKMASTWVTIPLDIRTPEAITILAGTITLTPGTVSADLSDGGHSLLVHALDAPDPDAVRDEIKTRYEARLKEIFA
ncbi:cation:proton antiporter [Roseivivax halodurans JCM 10272]|uniref:Cation:proton antiporter n=2 Tax=Roseivivax halodurans TaxID=93683 RepID=X7EKH6_9RHOB|nr:cation:proton antiporter [Roseivivax halodurans JCM 10272]